MQEIVSQETPGTPLGKQTGPFLSFVIRRRWELTMAGIYLAMLGLALAVTPNVVGQGGNPFVTEDFEDDTLNENPDGTWYTYSETETFGNANPQVRSVLSSQQWTCFRGVGDTTCQTATFTLNAAATPDYMEFTGEQCFSGGGSGTVTISLYNQNEVLFASFVASKTQGTDCNNYVGFNYPSANNSANGCTNTGASVNTAPAENVKGAPTNLTFDYDAQTVTLSTTNDSDTITCPFITGVATISKFVVGVGGTSNRFHSAMVDDFFLENVTASAAPTTSPVVDPINQARDFFADSWNMEATAVNWLFAIAIITTSVYGFVRLSASPLSVAAGVLVGMGLALALGYLEVWALLLFVFLVIAYVARTLFGAEGADGD